MKHQQQLLRAWGTRTGSGGTEQFSEQARQRIACLFLEEADSLSDMRVKRKDNTGPSGSTMELVGLGLDERLSVSVFCAELRNCQLSLIDILASNALEVGQLQSAIEHQRPLEILTTLLANLDRLITLSADKFMETVNMSEKLTSSPDNTGKQGKTLQHEIRTPLQGALLTTELMLEDSGHGDPVSAEDILAVRKSIETAVGILNDFASRAGTE